MLQDMEVPERGAIIKEFFSLLAVCHTVIPEIDDHGNIRYQAASPDEAALVVASKVLGAFFFRRTLSTVLVKELTETGEREVEYELLAVLEFNSTRKRQSVIIRQPDGSIRLYCKVNFLLEIMSSSSLNTFCE